jgi:transposase-like protein
MTTTNDRNTLVNPRLYVEHWLTTNNITVSESGTLVDELERDHHAIFDTMFLDSQAAATIYNSIQEGLPKKDQAKVPLLKEKDLSKALSEYQNKQRLIHFAAKRQELKFQSENTELLKWVKAVTGKSSTEDLAVMQHWCWLVKRKFFGLPVSNHIMPILVGKQRGGKTSAVERLTEPLASYMLPLDVENVTDSTMFKMFSKKYIIFTDEMGGTDKADIKKFKRQITTKLNSSRAFFTEDVHDHKMNISFIGAANQPIWELIKDETGLTRFWQIDCLDKLDWDVINAIDPLALWQGIDETKEDGYLKSVLSLVRQKQADWVVADSFMEWCDLHDIKVCPEGCEPKKIPTGELYTSFVNFCEKSGFKAFNSVWFGKKLSSIGIPDESKRINGVKTRVRLVAPDYMSDDQGLEGKILQMRGEK